MVIQDIETQAAKRYHNNKRDQAIFCEGAKFAIAYLWGKHWSDISEFNKEIQDKA